MCSQRHFDSSIEQPDDGPRPAPIRRRTRAFWFGLAATTFGTALHFPMYWESRHMGYHMADMPMDTSMIAGMVLIVVGLVVTTYGLVPVGAQRDQVANLRVRALDDAPINRVHVILLLVMAAAITIDVMKPTTLAFVVPGVAKEYGLKTATNPGGGLPAALLPLAGITGTVIGSFLWGWLSDKIGRKAAILLAGVFFVATSVCGAMPSFELNLLMCLIMGMSAGGMLPIAFTLLAETIPARHRGWLMVLIGGDIAGAYIITSWLSATVGDSYGWRVMWLIGFPTGLLTILLTRWIPESPRFLLALGRRREAEQVLRVYNASITEVENSELTVESGVKGGYRRLVQVPFGGITTVLVLVGLGVGLVVYGFQLWLPTNLRQLGYSGVSADQILRDSALIGFPLNFLVAYCYHRSSKWTMVILSALLAVSLFGFVALGDRIADNKILLYALLIPPIWGASSVVAVLVAYGAEVYPTRIRSRGTGLAAGMSKAGGIIVLALVVLAVAAPSISMTALISAVPMTIAAAAGVAFLVETRRRSLEEITAEELRAIA
ncbi:MFS transporter [Nocardia sp. XZ_19_369]|uniref:MFS transporter n=1 Tax=Nocardia sp. XZ_19_369 TaxID=2769487 RepID=UPI00188E541B|nr:MFS transporter [Nocardia sp. XZ_19_369]